MSRNQSKPARPMQWVPSLYFAEGLPYALTMSVTLVLYQNLGLPNKTITYYTGWLYLPWVIKPLWSPLVDLCSTRRQWIWALQLVLGGGLAGVALTLPVSHFFQITLAFFYLIAFASATHDIAADGFYLLANSERDQAFFSGIRNTCYRVATIAAQGGMVMLAGAIHDRGGSFTLAWTAAFSAAAGLLFCLGIYHGFILPRPAADQLGKVSAGTGGGTFGGQFLLTFAAFFRKPRIITLLTFLLVYRLGEAQLVRMVQLFLLGARNQGGLGLDDVQVGMAYGTIGVLALTLGGLAGGLVVAQKGLKFWLWPMLLAIHIPDAVFIWLAYAQPTNLGLISAGVALEQFGYGFGFTAYMMYMIYIARGEHATAHYAICTGFMALGMMVPGQWSGRVEEYLGYPHFFLWVLLATVPSFLVAARLPLDPEFGRKVNFKGG